MDLLLVLCFVFSTSWQWALALNMTGCIHQKPYPLVLDARRQPKGDIYTPGFEYGKYPDHSHCDYIIKAKSGYIIKLTFVEMEIEPSRSCGRDKVTVIDGASSKGPKLGDFCGLEPPPYPVVSSTSSMRLVFRTDWLIAKKGFHARYEAILPSEICRRGWKKCRNNRCYRPEQKCNGVDDCLDGSDEEKCKRPTPAYKCGGGSIRPIELEAPDRIVGGIEARPHSWPWQADLHVGKAYPNSHICGGTLVHPQWVLTAAHCVIGHPKAKSWRVHLGSHRRFKTDKYEQIRLVELVIMYPYYVGSDILGRKLDLLNDFALLKLNAPVNLTNGVKTACLLDNDNVLTPGTKCIATGWGTTRGTGAYKALKQAELYVQPPKTCRVNRSHQICVGSRKGIRGACHGDSGGPLHCKVSGKWFVVGVASYVTRTNMIHGLCAVGGTKSVYAGTASKIKWIEHALHMFG